MIHYPFLPNDLFSKAWKDCSSLLIIYNRQEHYLKETKSKYINSCKLLYPVRALNTIRVLFSDLALDLNVQIKYFSTNWVIESVVFVRKKPSYWTYTKQKKVKSHNTVAMNNIWPYHSLLTTWLWWLTFSQRYTF